MKHLLSPEQSATLIAKGISADKASYQHPTQPIFTLADIFGLLPKEITADTIMRENDVCPIRINWDTYTQKWFVGYELVPHPVGVGVDSELIDALFSILCWAIDNEHIDLTK